jgi:hypothetical protein
MFQGPGVLDIVVGTETMGELRLWGEHNAYRVCL